MRGAMTSQPSSRQSASSQARPGEAGQRRSARRPLREELKIRLVSGLGWAVMRLLGATYRVRMLGEPLARRRERGIPGRCIYAIWHESIWHVLPPFRGQGARVMISEHRDGEIITRVAHRLGYTTVRGSSTRGGARALLSLSRVALEGEEDLAVTVDGPRGPRREVKEGVLFAAARSGLPIVPVAIWVDRAWRLGSWDRMPIGKPFARVALGYGDELAVPADVGRDELATVWASRLAAALDGAEARARADVEARAAGRPEAASRT